MQKAFYLVPVIKMMMRYLIGSFMMLVMILPATAQDILFYKNDEQKKVKVVAIDNVSRIITYKSWDNLDGPDYKESISELRKVVYENGATYTFEQSQSTIYDYEKNGKPPVNSPSGRESEREDAADDYFTISAGVSLPVGEYASDDPTNEFSYLAQPGAGAQLDLGFLFGQRKLVGLAVNLGYQFHSIDQERMLELNRQLTGFYNLTLTVGKLKHLCTGIGPVVRIPIKVGSIDLRFLVGTDISIVPELELSNGFLTVTQESAAKAGVMVSPGVGIQFSLTEQVFIPVRMDYLYSQTHFSKVRISSSAGDVDYLSFDQKAQMLLISAGLGVNF